MSFRAPRRVCFDGNEGMIRPGLHPPLPAVRINNNLLLWSSVSDPSRDRVDSFPATLGCRRNPGELDGWAGAAFLGMASLRCKVKASNPIRVSAHDSFFGDTLVTHRAVPRPALFPASMLDLGILNPTKEPGRKKSPLAATN